MLFCMHTTHQSRPNNQQLGTKSLRITKSFEPDPPSSVSFFFLVIFVHPKPSGKYARCRVSTHLGGIIPYCHASMQNNFQHGPKRHELSRRNTILMGTARSRKTSRSRTKNQRRHLSKGKKKKTFRPPGNHLRLNPLTPPNKKLRK